MQHIGTMFAFVGDTMIGGFRSTPKKLKTLKDVKEWVDLSSVPCVCDAASRLYDGARDAAREWVSDLKKHFKQRYGRKGLAELNAILEAEDITYQKCLEDKAEYIKSDYVEAYAKISIITRLFDLEESTNGRKLVKEEET